MADIRLHLMQKLRSHLRTSKSVRGFREYIYLRKSPQNSLKHLVKLLDTHQIQCVLDIGANVGQFGLDLRRHGYRGSIISFEPIPQIADRLRVSASRNQPWKVMQCGISFQNGVQDIFVSGNSGLSSSFHEMLPSHLREFPESLTSHTLAVQVKTLDTVISDLGIDTSSILIKMDVQGSEIDVINGGFDTFSVAKFCYFEASLVPLYQGESTALALLNKLSNLGHDLVDVNRGISGKDEVLLQVDFLTRLRTRKMND